jgi:hypothetical protein
MPDAAFPHSAGVTAISIECLDTLKIKAENLGALGIAVARNSYEIFFFLRK